MMLGGRSLCVGSLLKNTPKKEEEIIYQLCLHFMVSKRANVVLLGCRLVYFALRISESLSSLSAWTAVVG